MKILDGAFGSLLSNRANFYTENRNSSLFLYHNLDIDAKIHEHYALAGADILSAHTFSLYGESSEIRDAVVELSKSARLVADKYNKEVALSLAPGCDYANLINLALPYIDYILLETFTSINELEDAISECLLFDKPIIACMVFGPHFSYDGLSVFEYFTRIGLYTEYIGFNCLTLSDLESLLPQTLGHDYQIVTQPNIGIPTIGEEISYPQFPMDKYQQLIKQYNIQLAGLCCGSTPQHIQQLYYSLKVE